MKYSIGQFAEIIGVTTDTLRLYERFDIIKPKRDKENNYRYYNDLDVRDLLMSRWYRSIQIPLHDVAELIKQPSKDNILKKIGDVEKELEDEIKSKVLLLNKIKEIKNDIHNMETSLNKCKKIKVPGLYRLKQTDRNTLIKEDFVKESAEQWMDLLPHTFYSYRINNKEIISGVELLEYSWGLAVSEKDLHNFNLHLNSDIEYIPPMICISAVILSTNRQYLTRNSFDFMFKYIEENNLSIVGDVIGKIIVAEEVDGEKKYFLEVNIPVSG